MVLSCTTIGMVYYCHSHTSYIHCLSTGTYMFMLSQYKTHVDLEVEVCFGSNQDANNVIVIGGTGNMKSSASILYKQSQGEEQNEQVNTNKHHILDQLSKYSMCTSVYRVRGTPTIT